MKEHTKKTISLEEAKAQFEELLEDLLAGNEIEITRQGKKSVQLSAQSRDQKPAESNEKRIFGRFTGQFEVPTDKEWAAMDKEIERDFEESELFPE